MFSLSALLNHLFACELDHLEGFRQERKHFQLKTSRASVFLTTFKHAMHVDVNAVIKSNNAMLTLA